VDVTTRNFFAPLWTMNMGIDASDTESNAADGSTRKIRQTATIGFTSATNLFQLQELKSVAKQIFEVCSTRNGTRVFT
jgi:hypothetical protein